MNLAQAPAVNREILGGSVDEPPVHLPVPDDDAVADDFASSFAVNVRTSLPKCAYLEERSLIEKNFEPLTSCKLSGSVLLGNSCATATRQCRLVLSPKFLTKMAIPHSSPFLSST